VLLATSLGVVATEARAQQPPARLPAVVVKAAPDPPGPRKLAGVVRDTGALALDSVEVSIVSLQRRVFSKADGTFLFDNIKPGTYDVRARKIGYGPQILEIAVDSAGGTGAFALLPLTRVLRPVVTTVARGGLSGVVGDTAFNALVGAEVRVLGHGEYTQTDASGAFHIPIRPGSYLVRVEQNGFADRLVSVIVPPDSGKCIYVMVGPPSRRLPVREVHNIDDFAARLTWRQHTRTRVYTHADLEQMNVEWVYEAVQRGFAEIHQGLSRIDDDCVAMVNGGPEIAELRKFTVDDVESVEIYDVRSPPPRNDGRPAARDPGAPIGTSRRGIDPVPLTNTELAVWANHTRSCTLVYVWLR